MYDTGFYWQISWDTTNHADNQHVQLYTPGTECTHTCTHLGSVRQLYLGCEGGESGGDLLTVTVRSSHNGSYLPPTHTHTSSIQMRWSHRWSVHKQLQWLMQGWYLATEWDVCGWYCNYLCPRSGMAQGATHRHRRCRQRWNCWPGHWPLLGLPRIWFIQL